MKRLLILALLVVSTGLHAQETERKFRFGLKASPLVGWIKEDFKSLPDGFTVEGGGARVGFTWGPSAEIVLNETFLISTGVDINYISGKLKGRYTKPGTPGFVGDWEQEHKLRFIDIPVMLKFRTKEIGYLRYFGLFGMGAGIKRKAISEYRIINGNNKAEEVVDPSKGIHLFRGSLLVGGGVEYNLAGNTSLVTSIVFNNGLTNILKNSSANSLKNNDVKNPFLAMNEKGINNYFMLNVGILF